MDALRRKGAWVVAALVGGLVMLVSVAAWNVFPWGEGALEYHAWQGRCRVHHRQGATREDARLVGDFLDQSGYFKTPSDAVVSLKGGTLDVAMVVASEQVGAGDVAMWSGIRNQMATQALKGRPFTLSLCEPHLVFCTTLPHSPDERRSDGGGPAVR